MHKHNFCSNQVSKHSWACVHTSIVTKGKQKKILELVAGIPANSKHSQFVFKSSNRECIKRKHIVVDDMIQNPKHIVCIYTSSNKELTKTTNYWTSSRCSTPETWPTWELAPASRDNHHCAMLFCHHQTAARRSSALAAPASDLDDRKYRTPTKIIVSRNERRSSE